MNKALLVIYSCGLLVLWAPTTYAQTQDCAAHFRQQRYLSAGNCFLQRARKVGATSRLKSAARLKKGAFLRNAAVSLMKAADAIKEPQAANYQRERALFALRSYERDKLCASQDRCVAARRQAQALRRQIGYARLALHFPTHPVAVQVTGYRFEQTRILKRSPWRLRLRPGRYVIALIGLGQKKQVAKLALAKVERIKWHYRPPPATRAVPPLKRPITREPMPGQPATTRTVVVPRTTIVPPAKRPIQAPPTRAVVARPKAPETRQPPQRSGAGPAARRVASAQHPPALGPRKTGAPIAAVAMYVVGGALLLTGAGLGIFAIIKYNSAVEKFNDPKATFQAAEDEANTNRTLSPISIIGIAAGAGILGIGGIIHAIHQAQPHTKPGHPQPRPSPVQQGTHTLWGVAP